MAKRMSTYPWNPCNNYWYGNLKWGKRLPSLPDQRSMTLNRPLTHFYWGPMCDFLNFNQRSITLNTLLTHFYWGPMFDPTQWSLCPSLIWIHQCKWIGDQFRKIDHILRTTYTYIHIHTFTPTYTHPQAHELKINTKIGYPSPLDVTSSFWAIKWLTLTWYFQEIKGLKT